MHVPQLDCILLSHNWQEHIWRTQNIKCISSKEQNSSTYNISAAEKSGLLKLIPALHLVKEDEAVLKPISPPRAKSLLPIAAESSKRGEGFKPILELMAAC